MKKQFTLLFHNVGIPGQVVVFAWWFRCFEVFSLISECG